MFKRFVFYFLFIIVSNSLADPLIVPETKLILNPSRALLHPHESEILISKTQIQQSNVKNIVDLLQNVGGIAVYGDSNSPSPTIGMRGFGDNGSSNTVILLNGFPLLNSDSLPINLNQIPIDSIQAIQVIPQSASVLYGNGAVGGVINIITEKPKHFMAGVRLGAGSYDGNSQEVYLGNQIKHFYYLIDVEKLRTNNNRAHDTLNENNGLINLGYEGENTQTDFSYHDNTVNQQYPGTIQQPSNNDSAFTHYHLYLLQIKDWLNDNWQLDNDLGYHDATTSGYLLGNFTQYRTGISLMPKLTGALDVDNILTTTGITATQDHYQFNSDPYTVNDTDKTLSTYTKWLIPVKQFYSIGLGANIAKQTIDLDNADGSNHAFVTEQAFNYDPSSQLHVYIRRAGTYRFPKVDETGEQNQILQTQTGTSYETGFTWKNAKIVWQMETYVIDLNNEIAFAASNPNDPIDQANRNLSPTRRIGFLVHTHYALTALVTLYGDYNLVDPYYRSGPFAGNTIPLVSKQLAKLGIGYQFKPHWQIYLASLYTSGSYAAGDDANQHYLGGYTIFNTHLNYDYKAWEVSFKINNLLNKQYSSYTVFSPYVQTVSDYPAPGRNYWVTVSYAFNK